MTAQAKASAATMAAKSRGVRNARPLIPRRTPAVAAWIVRTRAPSMSGFARPRTSEPIGR
jgi:hypothetical protein